MFELQIAIASNALIRRTVKRAKLEPGMQRQGKSRFVLFCGLLFDPFSARFSVGTGGEIGFGT